MNYDKFKYRNLKLIEKELDELLDNTILLEKELDELLDNKSERLNKREKSKTTRGTK